MKKSLFIFALFIVVAMLMGLVANVQPLKIIYKKNTTADELTEYSMTTESDENHNTSENNEEANAQQNKEYAEAFISSENTKQKRSATADNAEESLYATSDQNANTNVPPPDGRVYWSPEPPYAYTPTCTPKEWTMPIAPPEMDN
ncbi:MAG: hypothetical protein QW386_05610 [Candidatus Bathyarchaeia archaeon]